MPFYLFRASYTQQGIQGVMKEGAASRVTTVSEMAASVGGRIDSAYWAFGDDDFIAIAEDLIARKINFAAHLGICGGSNGGNFAGAGFGIWRVYPLFKCGTRLFV